MAGVAGWVWVGVGGSGWEWVGVGGSGWVGGWVGVGVCVCVLRVCGCVCVCAPSGKGARQLDFLAIPHVLVLAPRRVLHFVLHDGKSVATVELAAKESQDPLPKLCTHSIKAPPPALFASPARTSQLCSASLVREVRFRSSNSKIATP